MFGGDKGGYSVTNMSLLMSISDLLVCEGKSAMLLFCMFNVQTGDVQLRSVEASQPPHGQAYGCLIIRLCCRKRA